MRTLLAAIVFSCSVALNCQFAAAELRVGAAVTDVSPPQYPVLVNGGMLTRSADSLKTPVNARAIVLDDGQQRIAVVVVDSCMMPRPLLDDAKNLASRRTEIPAENMLISATHTHTAPSCMGALGTNADPAYVSFLREKLAESIANAEQRLQPAQVGWGVGQADAFTAIRRWIRRPDRVEEDPFGNPTVRANMHAARNWDDVTGPSGPEDPALSLISFQTLDGQPLAVLANFSMHYFSDRPISADYFGLFCEGLKSRLASSAGADSSFVGIMSHGCSGDIWRRDYSLPEEERPDPNIDDFAEGLVDIAMNVYEQVEYTADADLAMQETRLRLKYRTPDAQRLEWAEAIVEQMGDRPPQDRVEVYAREQVILNELQETDVVVQGLRIGDIGIATTPNETYALTGLKLKLQSPLEKTMVIELANGGDGYIPPPEQHFLGGYNTWAARSAGLEVTAEPKIVAAGLELLEKVAGKPRRKYQPGTGSTANATLELEPTAYWRMDEMQPPRAADSSGHHRDGIYEEGVVFFLEGPASEQFVDPDQLNRCPHFAGGRMRAHLPDLGESYTVSIWFWNGMPDAARATTGWLFSRDHEYVTTAAGIHLGVGGTATEPGHLILLAGDQGEPRVGRSAIERWTWNHLALVRDGNQFRVYLNGASQPDIETTVEMPAAATRSASSVFFGGRSDNDSNWEGRLDEIAIFDRALSAADLQRLSAAGP